MIVTGGSRGIGAATARLAARKGYKVSVNYARNADAATDVAEEIKSAGGEAIAVHADVSVEGDVVRLFRETEQELGPLTALVNNAGIVDVTARVEEFTAERVNRMMAINVTGSFLCAREAVLRMSTSHGGSGGGIVNISSAAARLASPNMFVDYAASKAAVDILTKGLAIEVAGEGIRVNAVRPGVITTDIHADAGNPDRAAEMAPDLPMKRAGTPEEVANAILWLLSEDASYVSGTCLDVSGGR
jgi:NAD(P)-dependent dehydrogenase (short-subunit alcohol dehydrogenase family)